MTRKKHTLRLVFSVIAGIATAMVLSGITHEVLYLCTNFPPPLTPIFETRPLMIALIYHSIYAVCGAIITAHLAKDRAKKAVFILGTKEAVLWLLGIFFLWEHSPLWYNISKALLGIPLAMLGGAIYSHFYTKNKIKRATL